MPRQLKHVFLWLLVFGTVALIVSGKASAAPVYAYPDCCNTSTYISASQQGDGIYLQAPIAYLKAKFSPDTHIFEFDFQDACYHAGLDGGSATPGGCVAGNVTIYICPSTPNGSFDSRYKGQGLCWRADPASWGAGGMGYQPVLIADSSAGSNPFFAKQMNPPVANGYKSMYVIVQQNVAGLNGFKITTKAHTTNVNAYAAYSRIGFGGGTESAGYPMSLVHLPLSSIGTSNYQLQFKIPCTYASKSFDLAWFDADRAPNGIPQDPSISWNLQNGPKTITAEEMAYISKQGIDTFLGGNNARRDLPITDSSLIGVKAGDLFTWRWTNVLNNNGVQVFLPFDEADADVQCQSLPTNHPPSGSLSASCSAGITPIFNDPDNGTKADLYMNGRFYQSLSSGQSGKTIAMPSAADYSPATFTLLVYDHQPDGSYTGPTQQGSPVAVGPCATLSCSISPSPSGIIEPTQNYSLQATYTYGGSAPSRSAITNASLKITGQPNQPITISNPAAGTFTITMNSPPHLSAGSYTVTSSATVGSQTANCNTTLIIANKPYLQVYGGDVTAGGGVPDETNSCGLNPNAQIVGWNKENTGSGDAFSGAGAQYAVRAMLGIQDFASALGGVGTPVILSFANNDPSHRSYGTGNGPGDYGGYFGTDAGAALGCNSNDITSLISSGNYVTSLPRGPVDTTTKSVVVHGNIYIGSNIMYSGGGTWAGVSQIPNFKVIADGGNIYIDPNVTELDGNYYAIPKAGDMSGTQSGLISTCANASGHEYDNTDSANFNVCKKQLIINGALKAAQIHFWRSCGSLTMAGSDAYPLTTPDGSTNGLCNGANHAAEIINAGPDSWINSGGGGGQGTDQSISSLPPVL